MTRPPLHFGPWGDVPADGDVQPFSMVDPLRGMGARGNRSHHFLSITYMKGFADARGRVQVYHADKPGKPISLRPSATAYENYYYSQPLPDGSRDNHRFEDLWNCVESVWPDTVKALKNARLSPAISLNVQAMTAISRIRVPAARDRTAILREAKLRAELRALEGVGKLPPELERYSGRLEEVPIGIDPHETLLAMREHFLDMGRLAFRLGFEVLHNRTNLPFITSDNPVCFYDPRRSAAARVPYEEMEEVELVFPLTATMLLRGTTKRTPFNTISRHAEVCDEKTVQEINATIAQFAYRMAIAQDRTSDDLVSGHAGLVPTVVTDVRRQGRGFDIFAADVFAPRPMLDRYIDTPEKAARLAATMSADGWD